MSCHFKFFLTKLIIITLKKVTILSWEFSYTSVPSWLSILLQGMLKQAVNNVELKDKLLEHSQ